MRTGKALSRWWGEAHPLTGLMYCADCGGKMYIQRISNGKYVPMYHCGNYPKVPVGTLCQSAHRIKADHVMEIVSKTIKEVIQYASLDKERFAEEIQSHIEDRQTETLRNRRNVWRYAKSVSGEYIPPTMAEKEPTPEELEEMRKERIGVP